MAFYRGSIIRADGSPCAEGVMITLDPADLDRKGEWRATVSSPQEVDLVAGQRYRLVLEDGRSGDFIVRRNTTAGGTSRAIAIYGVGALG